MSLFRSAEMKSFELYFNKEDSYDVVCLFHKLGFVHLTQSPKEFLRPYTNTIKMFQEMSKKIDDILAIAILNKVPYGNVPQPKYILHKYQQMIEVQKTTALKQLQILHQEIDKAHTSITRKSQSMKQNQLQIQELYDERSLLFKVGQIFGSTRTKNPLDFFQESSVELKKANMAGLNSIIGVILSKDIGKFQKILFRTTKGNLIFYSFSIPNQIQKRQNRHCFILVVENGINMQTKIKKICESFNAKLHQMQQNEQKRFQRSKQVQHLINEKKRLLQLSQDSLKQDLAQALNPKFFACSKIQAVRVIIQRQIIIYNAMNSLVQIQKSSTKSTSMAKIWVPTANEKQFKEQFHKYGSMYDYISPTSAPTHFQVNEFTAPFQQIIDTYGTPRYQEVNPTLYAIAIFPFLFGVMFGDIGHGGVLLCFAIFLVYNPQAKIMLKDLYDIRYLLLLMGIFSFYSGWIYNQFFSIPLNLFGTCYSPAQAEEYSEKQEGCVYPFGFDPQWIRASNQLNFFNSYKMKFAVVIGVLQMSFAIFLKFLNTVHFRSYLDLFFQWLPQQIFFFSTFGYMAFLIVFKWTVPWIVERDSSQAPSIIGQMIALPLKFGSTENKPLWDMQSQQDLQFILLVTALICVPMMLIPKPFIIWLTTPTKKSRSPKHSIDDLLIQSIEIKDDPYDNSVRMSKMKKQEPTRLSSRSSEHVQSHDISEIVVHQIIQTIQFVLGSISNTASYLRLWALSLAHGQLSKVFFEKTIGGGIESANLLVILIGAYLFFNITLGIIMGMDTMECFLHALRLQWVQFNNKFFKADGWKFMPLKVQMQLQSQVVKYRIDMENKKNP